MIEGLSEGSPRFVRIEVTFFKKMNMTKLDKRILAYFEASDKFRKDLSGYWLLKMQEHREWIENDIRKREKEEVERLQTKLFG